MHKFSHPEECLQDVWCLDQVPKRINEKPTPGIAPDLHTGWGMHLEEDVDFQRIFVLLLLMFVSSVLFGILWSVFRSGIQDAFSVASYIATCEALGVATVQLAFSIGVV